MLYRLKCRISKCNASNQCQPTLIISHILIIWPYYADIRFILEMLSSFSGILSNSHRITSRLIFLSQTNLFKKINSSLSNKCAFNQNISIWHHKKIHFSQKFWFIKYFTKYYFKVCSNLVARHHTFEILNFSRVAKVFEGHDNFRS